MVMRLEKYQDSKMMTLKKISHLSGFSTSTVSKALNDCFDISVDTKKLIQDLAFQYNYIPNKNAVALRKSKTNIIAVILPQINHQIYGDLLFDIQKTAFEAGYRIVLYQSFANTSKEKAFLEDVCDGSVDAAIILSTNGRFPSKTSIPIAHLQVFKAQTTSDLLERNRFNVEKLLKKIN